MPDALELSRLKRLDNRASSHCGMRFCMGPLDLNFDWNHARAFLVTAEQGSFSAAARALGIAQPTIGRQVAALEQGLGLALFNRTTNTLELTAAGIELLESVRAMQTAARHFSQTAQGQSRALEGTVCITASELIAAYILPPIITRLRHLHPGIDIRIVTSNKSHDLLRRQADIAIRNYTPKQPDLVAKKVADRHARLYANPSYLKQLGNPRTAADLSQAEFFSFDDTEAMITGLSHLGLELTTKNFPITTDNHLVQWEMCKLGAGICIVMDEVGDREPRVQRVLPDSPSFPVPIWIVAREELRTSRRLRVVYEILSEGLATSTR